MRHLTAADYRVMPWANGRGVTTEMVRVDRGGALDWRLSMAQVVEDGPFSRFPGIKRNLTVIKGPGFDLVGPGVRLAAAPRQPVAFSGDLDIRAENVMAPSVDFNVMVAGRAAEVHLVTGHVALKPKRAVLCVFVLAARDLAVHDLLISGEPFDFEGMGLVVAIPTSG